MRQDVSWQDVQKRIMNNKIIFEVEFEPQTVRHAYVTCPQCGRKYDAHDIGLRRGITYESTLFCTEYNCPVCGCTFTPNYPSSQNPNYVLKEVGYPACAQGALTRKEVWE